MTQHSYRELLELEPLGRRKWGELVWQQDDAGPHQANMVLDWLDKSRMGDSWAPSSPDMNPAAFCLWGYLKEKIFR